MLRKVFLLELELNIRDITCPGVWLCNSGNISLQVYLFGTCIQTPTYKPVFPIISKEKLLFHKKFDVTTLAELQKKLSKECIYIEFIQWQQNENPSVLAVFRTNLGELLYPDTNVKVCFNTDLLMEATNLFPKVAHPPYFQVNYFKGIIAPKIGVKTQTTIKEIWCKVEKDSNKINDPVTHKHIAKNRNRKVCHSIEYSKKIHSPHEDQKAKLEIKSNDKQCSVSNPQIGHEMEKGYVLQRHCCCCFATSHRKPVERSRRISCHKQMECPICMTYEDFFKRETHSAPGYRGCGDFNQDIKQNLGRKIHEKVTKTIQSIPQFVDYVQSYCNCYCEDIK